MNFEITFYKFLYVFLTFEDFCGLKRERMFLGMQNEVVWMMKSPARS